MSTAPGYHVRDRAALLLAALVAVNSVVVLVGWSAGWSAFVHPSPSLIPMAPTTGARVSGAQPRAHRTHPAVALDGAWQRRNRAGPHRRYYGSGKPRRAVDA